MAVGGVNVENLEEFFNAGASFAGIASGIFNRQDIIEQREEDVYKRQTLLDELFCTGVNGAGSFIQNQNRRP